MHIYTAVLIIIVGIIIQSGPACASDGSSPSAKGGSVTTLDKVKSPGTPYSSTKQNNAKQAEEIEINNKIKREIDQLKMDLADEQRRQRLIKESRESVNKWRKE